MTELAGISSLVWLLWESATCWQAGTQRSGNAVTETGNRVLQRRSSMSAIEHKQYSMKNKSNQQTPAESGTSQSS